MHRESFALYLLRLGMSIAILCWLMMMYWSSNALEEDTKMIKQEVSEIKDELNFVREEVKKAMQRPVASYQVSSSVPEKSDSSSLPNLLQKDPFYEKTLPGLLGDHFKSVGVYKTATYGKPQNLHPFSGFADVSSLWDMCTVSVGQMLFGKYETMAPSAAERMEEKVNATTQLPEFWIYLRKDIFWRPLEQRFFGDAIPLAPHFLKEHPLTAHDFKFWWDAMMNTYLTESGAVALRNYYEELDALEVIDDYTFVVRWKGKEVKQDDGSTKKMIQYSARLLTTGLRPLPRFVYQYFADGTKILDDDTAPDAYQKSSVWAQNFAQHWAKNMIPSCGAWKFHEMSDQRIVLKRNSKFYDPYSALMDTYELGIKSSPEAIWQEFKAGYLTSYSLQPDRVAEWNQFQKSATHLQQVATQQAIKELEYLARSYAYIAWNSTKPFFSSPKTRLAMTMAIDRKRIIDQNLNKLGVEIHGGFFLNSTANNPEISPWPFDPQAARKLLEEEGWYDSDGDGILDKTIDGKQVPFSFSLSYYVKNPTTKSIVDYVSTALKEIGIDCRLDGVDVTDLTNKIDDKSFDAYVMAWALGTPPEQPRQLWHSSEAKVKGSSNTVGFSNLEADQIIEKLEYETDKGKRTQLYHRFDEILHQEQPYTFLYTPKVFFLHREYLQNVFIPKDRQDLIPGADVPEPQFSIYWMKPLQK